MFEDLKRRPENEGPQQLGSAEKQDFRELEQPKGEAFGDDLDATLHALRRTVMAERAERYLLTHEQRQEIAAVHRKTLGL